MSEHMNPGPSLHGSTLQEIVAERDALAAKLAEVERERDMLDKIAASKDETFEYRLGVQRKRCEELKAELDTALADLERVRAERDEARALKVPASTEAVLQAQMEASVATTESARLKAENERLMGEVDAVRKSLRGLRADCMATYLGGYRTSDELTIFRHGMATVCNVVDAVLDNASHSPPPAFVGTVDEAHLDTKGRE